MYFVELGNQVDLRVFCKIIMQHPIFSHLINLVLSNPGFPVAKINENPEVSGSGKKRGGSTAFKK